MKRSTDRILTTHVGSLARPHELLDTLKERENGRRYDADLLQRQITAAVADRVQRQVDAGIDIVTDGEMSKTSFIDYVKDRLAGFEIDHDSPRGMAPTWQLEYDMFPEYYDGYLKKYSHTVAPLRRIKCTGPISYAGQEALATDIANLKAAVEGKQVTEVFMPATTPGTYGRNEYYSDRTEYLHAVADAMREEYLGIIEAGFILQIDDPGLIDTLGDAHKPLEERHAEANEAIDTLNHALRGIPAEKIRHHTCYGLNHGPRLTDIDLRDAIPFMLRINAGAYSFEVANPRHQHEWRIWEDVKLPDGKIIIPGLLGHANNYVEHPQLIAEYILRYANLVGRENLIAGADCGFSSRASYAPEVHPTVVWPKFQALAEGARLASAELWK
ncbi:MAG: cobalamin-independent methionine synthase II family protein [Acidimicrobiia bacterium]|nr:cobalamin-independent methionine synthase II family protein [Acidimicrobiia bacterium]